MLWTHNYEKMKKTSVILRRIAAMAAFIGYMNNTKNGTITKSEIDS